jgi:prepilin-type N-terminal cleavage/methylation domain-containing protein
MRRASGFTLLEVMVAMTITALALGSLFSVIAGNKRLAWRAEAALLHAIEVRSLINSAQLNDMQGEVFTESRKDKLQLVTDEKLKDPERKTQATNAELRSFHIKDEHGAELVSGSYWIRQQLPQSPDTPMGPTQSAQVFPTNPNRRGGFQGGQGQNGQGGPQGGRPGFNGQVPPGGFPPFGPNGGRPPGGRFGPNGQGQPGGFPPGFDPNQPRPGRGRQ